MVLCYRDMTFCVSLNCKNKCGRKLTKEIKDAAEEWWGKPNPPISVSIFCNGKGEVEIA